MANDYFNHSANVIAEGIRALASQVNNIATEISSGLDKLPTEIQLKRGLTRYAVDTGSADAFIITLPHVPVLTDGMEVNFRATTTTTGASTANVNATGAKSIVLYDLTATDALSIVANSIVTLRYSSVGDHYILMSGAASIQQINDAMTLDGLDSAQFLRSDVADTHSGGTLSVGTLTVTGAFTSLGIDDNATATAVAIDANQISTFNRDLNVGDGTQTAVTIGIDAAAAGNPALAFEQDDVTKAFIQYLDTGDIFVFDSDGIIELHSSNTIALTINSSQVSTFNRNVIVGDQTQALPSLTLRSDATGDPRIQFEQEVTAKAFIQYVDIGDSFLISADGEIKIRPSNTDALTVGTDRSFTFFPNTTTSNSIVASSNALTSGNLLYLETNNSAFTANLLNIVQDHASSSGNGISVRQDGTGYGITVDSNNAASQGLRVYSNIASRTDNLVEVFNDNATGTGNALRVRQDQGGHGITVSSNNVEARALRAYSNTASRTAPLVDFINDNASGTGVTLRVQQDQGGHGINSESNNVAAIGIRAYSNIASRTQPVVEIINDNATGSGDALYVQQDQGGHGINAESNNAAARGIRVYSNTASRTTPLADFVNDMVSPDAATLRVEGDVELAGTGRLTGKFINWSWAAQVGSNLSVTGVGFPALAALNGTDVAFIDSTNDDLRTYRFDGSTWSQVGSDLNIAVTSLPALTALNGTDVVFIDDNNDDLRTYRFNGSTWSQVGNDLNISGVSEPALAALNGTDVAFIDNTNDDLRTYRFDGTNWAQVGNDLNITGVNTPRITALNGTDIAYIDAGNDDLRTYRFDGTNWAQVGNDLNISNVGSLTIASLNGTDVAFHDGTNDELRIYRFDGTDWTQVGNALSITTTGSPALTAMNGSDLAYIDGSNQVLQTYRFSFSIGAQPHIFN